MFQMFARPVARLNPYTTPNPRVFICSASTPPGGGVHGMCVITPRRRACAACIASRPRRWAPAGNIA